MLFFRFLLLVLLSFSYPDVIVMEWDAASSFGSSKCFRFASVPGNRTMLKHEFQVENTMLLLSASYLFPSPSSLAI